MYAIIRSGDKQFKVEIGSEVKVPALNADEGEPVSFDEVLLYNDDKKTVIGNPVIKNVKVSGTVLKHGKDRKIVVLKYKKRKRSRTKTGHRQKYTLVKIEDIKKSGK